MLQNLTFSSSQCAFHGEGDKTSPEYCRASCGNTQGCNAVHWKPQGKAWYDGGRECKLESCPQPFPQPGTARGQGWVSYIRTGGGRLSMGFTSTLAVGCQDGATVGRHYNGSMSATISGRTCQKWSESSPHKHRFSTLGEHSYCRNPDGEPGVWCYTTDPGKRWDFCNVPPCLEEDDLMDTVLYVPGEWTCKKGLKLATLPHLGKQWRVSYSQPPSPRSPLT